MKRVGEVCFPSPLYSSLSFLPSFHRAPHDALSPLLGLVTSATFSSPRSSTSPTQGPRPASAQTARAARPAGPVAHRHAPPGEWHPRARMEGAPQPSASCIASCKASSLTASAKPHGQSMPPAPRFRRDPTTAGRSPASDLDLPMRVEGRAPRERLIVQPRCTTGMYLQRLAIRSGGKATP